MLKRLRRLNGAGLLPLLASDPVDFGDVVAVLIVLIGLVPFASAGLWVWP